MSKNTRGFEDRDCDGNISGIFGILFLIVLKKGTLALATSEEC